MIVTKLAGGIGNQFFQYSIGRHLSMIHNTPLYLDVAWYDNTPQQDTNRPLDIFNYNISARVADQKTLHEIFNPNFLTKIGIKDKFTFVQEDASMRFDPSILSLPDNTYISGYWQNANYISSIRNELIRELSNDTIEMSAEAHRMHEEVVDKTSVALHVRRGDYMFNDNMANLDLNYYTSAIQFMDQQVQNPKYFVFSDDIEWCVENLQISDNIEFVHLSTLEDFEVMRACRHFIIANSSYSWWAAWLGNRAGKRVIAPKLWFNNNIMDPSGLQLPEWTIL